MAVKKLNMGKILEKLVLNLMMICHWLNVINVWIIKILQYQKIHFSEGIDVNKTSASEECELCHYWFFKDVGFKFEQHVCNKCHDLLTMAHSLKNIAILSAKGNTFRCLLRGISKNEGLKILNNSVIHERGVL